MHRKQKGKKEDIMTRIKPIQATPALSGQDAVNLISQIKPPTKEAQKKNNLLSNILTSIRKG